MTDSFIFTEPDPILIFLQTYPIHTSIPFHSLFFSSHPVGDRLIGFFLCPLLLAEFRPDHRRLRFLVSAPSEPALCWRLYASNCLDHRLVGSGRGSLDSMSCRVLGVGTELDSRSVGNLECVVDERSRRAPLRPSKASMAMVGSNNADTVDRGSKALLREVEYERSVSSRRLFAVGLGYFGLESLYLLIGLTLSLLILPLVLPPLPPPPFMLLLLPICILACLMILAFMPSNVRDLTSM